MHKVFIGLGSNLGDREANVREALDRLTRHSGIRVKRISSFYETEPVGFKDQPDFINAAALIETDLSPTDLLEEVLSVERGMGRIRSQRWGPRVIDIDVLLYEDLNIDTPELTIPHPGIGGRAFVLIPLLEIAPDITLPGGRRAHELLEGITDQRVCKRTG